MRAACPILWWNSTVAARIGGQTVTAVLSGGNDPEAFCAFVRKLDPVPKAILRNLDESVDNLLVFQPDKDADFLDRF